MKITISPWNGADIDVPDPCLIQSDDGEVTANPKLIELLAAWARVHGSETRFQMEAEVYLSKTLYVEDWFEELGAVVLDVFGDMVQVIRRRGELPDGSRLQHDLIYTDEAQDWVPAVYLEDIQHWVGEETTS